MATRRGKRASLPGDAEKRLLLRKMNWVLRKGKGLRRYRLPPGVVGFGFGLKRRGGKVVAESCIRVYVRQKLDQGEVAAHLFIPETIDGVMTDIIEAPVIAAHSALGDSIGTQSANVGTIGCLVSDGTSQFVLSNNHVLADLNQGVVDDPIFMPSLFENGAAPAVAQLVAYPKVLFQGADNQYDAAMAKLNDGVVIDPTLPGGANLAPSVAPVAKSMAVSKVGAPTQQTTGTIDGVNENIDVMYFNDPARTAHFVGQIAILGDNPPFSADGDSGSLVWTSTGRQPVGLLLGGTQTVPGRSLPHSFASPLQPILDRLKVTVVTR